MDLLLSVLFLRTSSSPEIPNRTERHLEVPVPGEIVPQNPLTLRQMFSV